MAVINKDRFGRIYIEIEKTDKLHIDVKNGCVVLKQQTPDSESYHFYIKDLDRPGFYSEREPRELCIQINLRGSNIYNLITFSFKDPSSYYTFYSRFKNAIRNYQQAKNPKAAFG